MWFLDTKTLRLVGESEFKRRSSQGKYAILSHRWDDEGELSFQDMAMLEHATHGELSFQDMAMLKHVTRKSGYRKIKAFCQHAAREGYEFAWADTCCIDKLSSAELQEAINSMWRWYREASICYVYLHDVQRSNSMWYHDAEWFTRGWTLQELLAPEYTTFFDQDWEKIGNRDTLTVKISRATGIPVYILRDPGLIPRQSIAARMSWAAGRKTTKIEDRAYSLLGLLGVHMPIIYGEQEASMARLQRLLLDRNDETLFAWSSAAEGYHGFLAPSPDAFAGSGRLEPTQTYELGRHPFKSTDAGIRLTTEYLLPYTADVWVVPINCGSDGRRVGLFLRLLRRLPGGMTHFIRVQVDGEGIASATLIARLAERQSAQERKIFLPHPASQVIESSLSAERINGFRIGMSLKRHLDSEMPNESSRWTKTNDFPWSKCGQSKYHLHASLRGNKQIRGFVLGFDRDYNPWCYLREHDAAVGDLDLSQEHFDEQSEPDVARRIGIGYRLPLSPLRPDEAHAGQPERA
ncbi:hypothetical protein AMS68_008072 [Peltaster fructicola]|uniref:Heterokaryon incompatibility domain-containing protein n=1 Tax=Peltaster fructicola TaxID=286661 RepID=A0A6H0Y6N2_9PEZI|nr:hypothetical protein AMS68_008072 [Peltaster fructicola]